MKGGGGLIHLKHGMHYFAFYMYTQFFKIEKIEKNLSLKPWSKQWTKITKGGNLEGNFVIIKGLSAFLHS